MKNRSVFVSALDAALPSNIVTNADLLTENPHWDMAHLEERTGVSERRIALPGQTALDLAEEAFASLASKRPEVRESIDGLIFCTETPDHAIPGNAPLLHHRIGLRQSAFSFDINMGCSGYVHCLDMAKQYIRSGAAETILIATGDTYSHLISPGDRATRVLFGDGACVTLVSACAPEKGVVDTIFGTDGGNFDRFYVPAGGARNPASDDTKAITVDRSGNERNLEQITMEGFKVLTFFNSVVPASVKNLLNRNSLEVEDIKLFIFHQASKVALDSLTKSLRVSPDRVLRHMEKTGNLVSSSVPVTLKAAMDENLLQSGDKAVLCGFGVGLSWAASLYIVP